MHDLTPADFTIPTAEDVAFLEMALACAATAGVFDLDDVIAELGIEED